jgi:hypothetical protein
MGANKPASALSILIKTPVVSSCQSRRIVSSLQCNFLNQSIPHQTSSLLLSLLPNLTLNSPLQRLALIMLQLPLLLLRLIASQTSKSAAHSSTNTIAHTFSKVAQLALRLLAFTLCILLLARFAHTLEAQGASKGFFAGADGLVPRAGGAVGVVFCDSLGAD